MASVTSTRQRARGKGSGGSGAGHFREADTRWCAGTARQHHDSATGRTGAFRYQGAHGGCRERPIDDGGLQPLRWDSRTHRAVIDHGFKELDRAFSQLPVTDDPIADLAVQALTCWRVARDNPHLYDLMFGLSTRATYRPLTDSEVRLSGRSPAFRAAYAHVAEACTRLVSSGRVRHQDPEGVAAQLWSFVHGFITLELAETFVDFDDPVRQVLLPLGVNLSVGLGDTRERAEASHEEAARIYSSIARTGEVRRA